MDVRIFSAFLGFLAGTVYASGTSLQQDCEAHNTWFIKNKMVQNFNVTRDGFVNYKLRDKLSKKTKNPNYFWYFLHADNHPNHIQGVNLQYDFLKLAYQERVHINVCVYEDGNTFGLERAKDAND